METVKREPHAVFGGHSMAATLRVVMVCPPSVAGWDQVERASRWEELGYLRPPEFAEAAAQHRTMTEVLESAGAEVVRMPSAEALSLDAVYVHDASFLTDFGAVSLRMGKEARSAEPGWHVRFYESRAVPILGEIRAPGTAEAGDMVWLDARNLIVGRGYRTKAQGIEQIRALLGPKGVEVWEAPLPHGPGPEGCLHLMSLMSVLDERTVLVDLPWLSVSTVEILARFGFRWIEIDPDERETLAANILALGRGRLLALEENVKTNARLRDAGFQVLTFPGSEIALNGGGGPTCLTRPIRRG